MVCLQSVIFSASETKMWINSSLESEACYVSSKDTAFLITTTYYEKIYTET